MKTFFGNGYVYAKIEPVIVRKEDNGIAWTEKEVNVKEIKDIVKALEMLGKEVKSIQLDSTVFCDMDTDLPRNRYYKRFPECVIDKAWNQLSSFIRGNTEVFIKGDRLYMNADGYRVVLPREMSSDYDTGSLGVSVYFY